MKVKELIKKHLGHNKFKLTDKHYGNSIHHIKGGHFTQKLTKIYVEWHVFDHTEINRLGYGIVVKKELFN